MTTQQDLFAGRIQKRKPEFDGQTYESKQDKIRLTGQTLRVADLMLDGHWRTLQEIADATGDPQASVSARLRDLRKKRFGEFEVKRRSRGPRDLGLFEYQVSRPAEAR